MYNRTGKRDIAGTCSDQITNWWTEELWFDFQQGKNIFFSLLQSIHTSSRAKKANFLMGTRGLFLGGKAARVLVLRLRMHEAMILFPHVPSCH